MKTILPFLLLTMLAACSKDKTHCYHCFQETETFGANHFLIGNDRVDTYPCGLTSDEATKYREQRTGSDTDFKYEYSGFPGDTTLYKVMEDYNVFTTSCQQD